MKFYHAATPEIMKKIVDSGVIRRSWDGVVYLCDNAVDAVKFVAIRGAKIVQVIEVELDKNEVKESVDHCEAFFGCKAYTYGDDICLPETVKIEEYAVGRGNVESMET